MTNSGHEPRYPLDGIIESKSFIQASGKNLGMLYNQFEPYIVTSERDIISVYDSKKGVKVRSFVNGNPDESSITMLKFINEDDIPLLAVGSGLCLCQLDALDEGCIRIYKKYQDTDNVGLVSSWRALNDLMPPTLKHPMNKILDGARTGLIADWNQSSGCFFVSGGVKVIRVWDAEREKRIQDIPTKSVYTLSSLSSEKYDGGNLIFAGCSDGSVRKYDRRIAEHDSMVHVFSDHKTRILNVSAKSNDELVTASVDGDIRIWDVRHSIPLTTYSVGKEVSHVASHEFASIVTR